MRTACQHTKGACTHIMRQECTSLCRSQGIFSGRLIKESLKSAAGVVSDGAAVNNGLTLIQCSFQSHCKGSRFGRTGVALLRVTVFALCFRSPRYYLNPIHLEIRKSVCCVNPSLTAYFNSVIPVPVSMILCICDAFVSLMFCIIYIGRNQEKFTVNLRKGNKNSDNYRTGICFG